MKNKTKPRATLNYLRKYRRSRGLLQKEVAEILGLKSASAISRWEKGLCLPSTKNLFKLASLYRTMVEALYMDQLRTLRFELQKTEAKILKVKTEQQNEGQN